MSENTHQFNPAWAFKQKQLEKEQKQKAKEESEKAEAETLAAGAEENKEFLLLLTSLENDLKRLGKLGKGSPRNKLKESELLPQYRKHIEAYIEVGEVYENPVLAQCMIWAFDCGLIEEALKLGEVMIEQNQPMPERFKRDAKTFIADAVYQWVKDQQVRKADIEPHFSDMLKKIDGGDWQVHDDILINYLKLQAQLKSEDEPEEALKVYEKILGLDAQAKVSTAVKKLEKRLGK